MLSDATFLGVPNPRSPRERTEELERASLSAWATLSADTKGREHAAAPDPLRSAFQIDRDRIVESLAFTRLQHKTHAFATAGSPPTRLDHTLQVAGLARTLARALGLNEDLTEAVALGRDLGATPFGPAGAAALSLFTHTPFRHNHQSIRVVERLENDGEGLNLTWEVRDGIAGHTQDAPTPSTREGEVVRLCDRIARLTAAVRDLAGALPGRPHLGGDPDPARWAAELVRRVVRESAGTPDIGLPDADTEWLDHLAVAIGEWQTTDPAIQSHRARASHCLSSLVVFYLDNPDRLPPMFRPSSAPSVVGVVDFVALLPDARARGLFDELFLPSPL